MDCNLHRKSHDEVSPIATVKLEAEAVISEAIVGRSWRSYRLDAYVICLGVLIAMVFAMPFFGPGRLLALDWVSGSHQHLADYYSGFGPPSGSIFALIKVFASIFGGSVGSWLLPTLFFPLAAFGSARMVGGSLARRMSAAMLYMVNPFVFERFAAGQMGVLLGYALLPLAVRSVLGCASDGWRQIVKAALWTALAASLSYHFVFIIGLVVVGVVIWEHRWSVLGRAAGIVLLIGLLSAYVILPSLGPHSTGVAVGSQDLASYRTASDPTWGLYLNVLGLYGFWRAGPVLPKSLLVGWPLILLAILVIVGLGARKAWRDGERLLVGALGVAALLAYFLSLGDQGPTGSVFRWLYMTFPPFDIMREPEKFSSMLALVYAVGFGYGAEELVNRVREVGSRRAWSLGLLAVMPLLYCPNIVYGLGGQLTLSQYPTSWQKADAVMGDGPGNVLFLPWHEYMSFPFSHGVIATPAKEAFRRPVISGDNVEVDKLESDSTSARSAYLQYLFAHSGELHEFGHLVAQLGVSYVALAHTVDYRSFSWLNHQTDLVKIFDSPEITVYKNQVALPQGARVVSSMVLPSLADYVRLAQIDDLRGTAVFLGKSTPYKSTSQEVTKQPVVDVRRLSLVGYSVASGPPGWVILPESYSSVWKLDGKSGIQTADGLVAISSDVAAGSANYVSWHWVRAGDVISVITLGGLLVVLLLGTVLTLRRTLHIETSAQQSF